MESGFVGAEVGRERTLYDRSALLVGFNAGSAWPDVHKTSELQERRIIARWTSMNAHEFDEISNYLRLISISP
jgi:hypothetical protein